MGGVVPIVKKHSMSLSQLLKSAVFDLLGKFQVVERGFHSFLLPHIKPHGCRNGRYRMVVY